MSAGVRPERPSLAELIGERPPLESLIGGEGITPGRSKFTPEQLVARANRSVAQSEDELEAAGGYNPTTHKIMGTAASLARDVPGAEVIQALASAGVNRIPYREALGKIREVEGDAGKLGTAARIGGGAVSAALLPGSAVTQGARYGVLHGVLQADPDADLKDRVRDAAIQGSVGAVAPKVPGLLAKAAKGTASNVAASADVALSPFSHGARVRTVGRFAGLLRDAAKTGVKEAGESAPHVPTIEGFRPIGEMIERAPARVLPFRAPPVADDAASAITKQNAPGRLASLLQKNLDEGMEAAESVKGYPISGDPPTNTALMRRIEEALLRAKAGRSSVGAARATPRKGITTPPRTVADVLKGGRQ